MGKGRLEAFSDGVLAVAITLLVLDLQPMSARRTMPGPSWACGTRCTTNGRPSWPTSSASSSSASIWVNHHALFVLIEHVDRAMLFYNLLLLFWVCTIPFTTSALAEFFRDGTTNDVRVAVLLYGLSNEGMAIAFLLIVRHMLYKPLVKGPVDPTARRRAVIMFGLGSIVYPVITVVGLFSAVTMYVLYIATIVYYIVDQTQLLPDRPGYGRRRRRPGRGRDGLGIPGITGPLTAQPVAARFWARRGRCRSSTGCLRDRGRRSRANRSRCRAIRAGPSRRPRPRVHADRPDRR